MENAEIAEIVEDAPAEGPAPVPAPAPAPTLEIVHERPHSKSKEKSTENFGRLASTYSDFYIRTLSQPGLVDTQYNVLTFCKTCKYSCFSFLAQWTHIELQYYFFQDQEYRAIDQLLSEPSTSEYTLVKFNKSTIRTFVIYCDSFV